MAQYPFGIKGWRRNGPSQTNLVAMTAVAITALAWLLAALLLRGVFTGGPAQCGDFGFSCLGNAVVAVALGSSAGTIAALCSFAGPRRQRWLCWLALLLNGAPLLAVAVMALLVFVR